MQKVFDRRDRRADRIGRVHCAREWTPGLLWSPGLCECVGERANQQQLGPSNVSESSPGRLDDELRLQSPRQVRLTTAQEQGHIG